MVVRQVVVVHLQLIIYLLIKSIINIHYKKDSKADSVAHKLPTF